MPVNCSSFNSKRATACRLDASKFCAANQNFEFEIIIYTKPINFLISNLENRALKVLFMSPASSKLHKTDYCPNRSIFTFDLGLGYPGFELS